MRTDSRRFDEVTGETRGDEGGGTPRASAKPDSRFRLGIAGYDLWPHAVNFCRALANVDFAHISAVWDEDPRHLARLVELTGAAAYTDLHAFCRSDVQGVIITARTSWRAHIARAMAAAGKHILSDKPMAMTTTECLEILHACRQAGVVLMGGYNFRFWNTWRLMKKVMETGELGEPLHLYCAYNTGMVRRSEWEDTYDSYWTDPAATPGGGWLTHGDHAIDLTRWLFGVEFIEVLANMRKLRYPQYAVEDYGVAHFVLSNGGTAVVHSDAISPSIRLEVVVICQNGGMSYTIKPEPRLKVWGAPSLGANTVEYAVPEHWLDALREMTRAFVQSVASGAPPPITGEDNMRVIEVVEAAYRSAREGRGIVINHVPAG
ncbi:MAG: Gfo/Idh/MocA family oxidoreductase [Chloroflexi bacterium]|nr:Gfo/Idh/MocA family oxidoreductase [Chloroflexota bacterium]